MSRGRKERRLAQTVIYAAAKELGRAGKGNTVLAQLRTALSTARDTIMMVGTMGDTLTDGYEEAMEVCVGMILALERGIDETIGAEPDESAA